MNRAAAPHNTFCRRLVTFHADQLVLRVCVRIAVFTSSFFSSSSSSRLVCLIDLDPSVEWPERRRQRHKEGNMGNIKKLRERES